MLWVANQAVMAVADGQEVAAAAAGIVDDKKIV